MSVNLGPLAASIGGVPSNPQADGYGYNPRCLRRDVNVHSAAVTHTNYTYSLITKPQNADIYWFQTDMQGQFPLGEWGVHAGGHFTIGGDPGGVGYARLFSTLYTIARANILNSFCVVGFLHESWRSVNQVITRNWKQKRGLTCTHNVLSPPRTNRQRLVDLATPRPRQSTHRCIWNSYT